MNTGTSLDLDVLLSGQGIRITADLEPMTGPGTPVKSAVYSGEGEGTKAYPFHDRPDPDRPGGTVRCSTLLSDEASRNIAESQLLERLPNLRSLEIVAPADKPEAIELPVDVLELPHSVAAGHLLMTSAPDDEGTLVPFRDSTLGRGLYRSGVFDISWLYEHVPGFVISGFWFSQGQGSWPAQHPNSKVIASTRLPVTAYGAIALDRGAGAIDPVVLSTEGLVLSDKVDEFGVRVFSEGKAAKGTKARLSAIGIGSIAPTMRDTPWITAERIDATGMVSLTTIRRLRSPSWTLDQTAAAHDVLAALTLAGTLSVLDDPVYRSGCELVRTSPVRAQVLGSGATEPVTIDLDTVLAGVAALDEKAVETGLPSVFGSDQRPARLPLVANDALLQVLDNSRNKARVADEA